MADNKKSFEEWFRAQFGGVPNYNLDLQLELRDAEYRVEILKREISQNEKLALIYSAARKAWSVSEDLKETES